MPQRNPMVSCNTPDHHGQIMWDSHQIGFPQSWPHLAPQQYWQQPHQQVYEAQSVFRPQQRYGDPVLVLPLCFLYLNWLLDLYHHPAKSLLHLLLPVFIKLQRIDWSRGTYSKVLLVLLPRSSFPLEIIVDNHKSLLMSMSHPLILTGIVRKSIIIIDTIPSSITDNLCLLLLLYRRLELLPLVFHLLAWNSSSSSHPSWCVLFATIPTFVDEPWSSAVLSFIIIWHLALLVSENASIARCLYAANKPHSTHLYAPDLIYKSVEDTSLFSFYLISKHSWPSWVSWWVVCKFWI